MFALLIKWFLVCVLKNGFSPIPKSSCSAVVGLGLSSWKVQKDHYQLWYKQNRIKNLGQGLPSILGFLFSVDGEDEVYSRNAVNKDQC